MSISAPSDLKTFCLCRLYVHKRSYVVISAFAVVSIFCIVFKDCDVKIGDPYVVLLERRSICSDTGLYIIYIHLVFGGRGFDPGLVPTFPPVTYTYIEMIIYYVFVRS